jgi:hypothetical protein
MVYLLTLAGWPVYHAQCVAPFFYMLVTGAVVSFIAEVHR